MEKIENKVWYAMRATYCRELRAKQLLDQYSIRNFIPMQYKVSIKNRRKRRELVPAIRNLIFVHTTPSSIKEIKSHISYLQYMTETRESKRVPITIPEDQMQRFIAVTGTHDEQLLYMTPEEVNLKTGTKVRILGGLFEGLEGIFVKLKGVRDKRVVVSIQGVIAVAIATLRPDLIEPIKN